MDENGHKRPYLMTNHSIFICCPRIRYILKEKHCNKCIHIIIDTWQPHHYLIINMLTRSHCIHKCVHTIYFVFFNIKLTCMVPIKFWIFWFESKQVTNQKLNYIYMLFLLYTDKVGQNIYKFWFDSLSVLIWTKKYGYP